jgi:hypothetical protein
MNINSLKKNVDVPLSITYPDIVGEIDEDETDLMCNGAYDLILIENASEIFRLIAMDTDLIESIMNIIIKENKGKDKTLYSKKILRLDKGIKTYEPDKAITSNNIYVVDSHSFPDVETRYILEPKIITDPDTFEELKEYLETIRIARLDIQKIKDGQKNDRYSIMMTVALSGDDGGHYASLIYEHHGTSGDDRLYLFDSMQFNDGDDKRSSSGYTHGFKFIGLLLFNIKPKVIDDISMYASLQITGGFLENESAFVNDGIEKKLLDDRTVKYLTIQNTESQNHFCYMWGIWYTHLRVLNIDVASISETLYKNNIDPFIVIKRYIWYIYIYLNLKDTIKEHFHKDGRFFISYFEKHFPCVWTNTTDMSLESKLSLTFNRYEIKSLRSVKKIKNIDDCLLFSIDMKDIDIDKVKNTTILPNIKHRFCS